MRPTLEISNDPRYSEPLKRDNEVLNEITVDDNNQECMIFGTYKYENGIVVFYTDHFQLISQSDYSPVMSEESKGEIIRDLIKDKHGRNVNFV